MFEWEKKAYWDKVEVNHENYKRENIIFKLIQAVKQSSFSKLTPNANYYYSTVVPYHRLFQYLIYSVRALTIVPDRRLCQYRIYLYPITNYGSSCPIKIKLNVWMLCFKLNFSSWQEKCGNLTCINDSLRLIVKLLNQISSCNDMIKFKLWSLAHIIGFCKYGIFKFNNFT